MDAPKCRLCDKRHYGLCAGLDPLKRAVESDLKGHPADQPLESPVLELKVPKGWPSKARPADKLGKALEKLQETADKWDAMDLDELKTRLADIDLERTKIRRKIRRHTQRLLMRKRREKS